MKVVLEMSSQKITAFHKNSCMRMKILEIRTEPLPKGQHVGIALSCSSGKFWKVIRFVCGMTL